MHSETKSIRFDNQRYIYLCIQSRIQRNVMYCFETGEYNISIRSANWYRWVAACRTDCLQRPKEFQNWSSRWPEPIACLETPRLRRRGLVFVQNLLVRLLERALLSGEGRIEGKLCPGQSSLSFQKPFNTACSFSWLLGAELFWNMSVCYSSGHCARPIAWGSRSRMSGRIGILC